MNNSDKYLDFEECKIQASLLLKSLHSSDVTKIKHAIKRLRCLAEFADLSMADMAAKTIKHKHALTVVARENGFKNWADLKTNAIISPPYVDGFLNKWFAHYDEAKAQQKIAGGLLLPYKNQFFICDTDYIQHIGLDPKDPDWDLMSWDWVKPTDLKARERLAKKWLKIQRKQT